MAITVKQLEKKCAKVTLDFSSQRTIDSAYTFDAANISEDDETITILNHPYKTGDIVGGVLTATTGVTATTPAIASAYYVIVVDKDTIQLATSLALAKAGTHTDLTAGACVDMYLQRNCLGLVGTGLMLPAGAIIDKVTTHVETTCISWAGAWGAGNADKATMSIGINAANDILAAVAIETAGDMWDAGIHGTIVTGFDPDGADLSQLATAALFAARRIKVTADSEMTVTIATDAISIGKVNIYVEYYV